MADTVLGEVRMAKVDAKIVNIGGDSYIIGKLPRKVDEDTPVGQITLGEPRPGIGGAGICCDTLCCDTLCGTDASD